MEIIAEILAYLNDDLHFDYEDGYSEWFDGTKLKIIEPVRLKNEIIYIYHNQPKQSNNIWKKIGSHVKLIYKFEIKSIESLKSHDIFSEGVIIEELE